jgi:hypothetical protein
LVRERWKKERINKFNAEESMVYLLLSEFYTVCSGVKLGLRVFMLCDELLAVSGGKI